MDVEKLVESTGLHEGRIMSISLRDNNFSLHVDNVFVDLECKERYNVVMHMTVQKVTKDDEVVDTLKLEGDGSSIIQFERSGNSATLVVDWIYYKERKTETRAYEFIFDTFNLQATRQQA